MGPIWNGGPGAVVELKHVRLSVFDIATVWGEIVIACTLVNYIAPSAKTGKWEHGTQNSLKDFVLRMIDSGPHQCFRALYDVALHLRVRQIRLDQERGAISFCVFAFQSQETQALRESIQPETSPAKEPVFLV